MSDMSDDAYDAYADYIETLAIELTEPESLDDDQIVSLLDGENDISRADMVRSICQQYKEKGLISRKQRHVLNISYLEMW